MTKPNKRRAQFGDAWWNSRYRLHRLGIVGYLEGTTFIATPLYTLIRRIK